MRCLRQDGSHFAWQSQSRKNCAEQTWDVPLVVLLDTSSPSYHRKFRGIRALPMRTFFFVEKLIYHLGRLPQMRPRNAIGYTFDRIQLTPEVDPEASEVRPEATRLGIAAILSEMERGGIPSIGRPSS